MKHGHFYKWIEQFRNSQTSVTNRHCSGHSVEVSIKAVEMDTLIQENW